ncbi:MAG: helix-turn-helix transcriptional regulator [Oscillospiraceae bacterium]|nr:helix-turn-helix transcriptional regulator [Oscillospiraceae bacterium]
MDKLTCDCDVIHEEAVQKARGSMAPKEEYRKLAELLKMFGDGTRVQMLHVLAAQEMCVCDLAALLGVTKSAVSHQLKALRLADLVTFRREGQNVYYTIADDHVRDILEIGFAHLGEKN